MELEERAWRAKMDEEDATEESTMVRTFGKVSLVSARGETETHISADGD